MSIDKSLKSGAALSKHNNVLKRADRIAKLQEDDQWLEGQSPFGLPKIAHRKVKVGGKDKKAEQSATTEGEQTPEAEPEKK